MNNVPDHTPICKVYLKVSPARSIPIPNLSANNSEDILLWGSVEIKVWQVCMSYSTLSYLPSSATLLDTLASICSLNIDRGGSIEWSNEISSSEYRYLNKLYWVLHSVMISWMMEYDIPGWQKLKPKKLLLGYILFFSLNES